jgi:hypothetical protein
MGKTATLANIGSVADSSLGFRNRIINGAMVIAQRGTSAVSGTGAGYAVDRWSNYLSNGSLVYTLQQSSTAPPNYTSALALTITTGSSSGTSLRAQLTQPIEGNNIADLGFGTAYAKTITISFWVRCSLTGQFGGAVANYAQNRSYPFTYTINSANTWEQKSITIAGDTSGTWSTDNSGGMILMFDLGTGTVLQGTAGAWAGADYRGATGDTSVVATTGATFYITGVQLEKGATATSFDYRPYGTELALCQRYLPEVYVNGTTVIGFGSSTTSSYARLASSVPTRVAPTGISVSASNQFAVYSFNSAASGTASNVVFSSGDTLGVWVQITTTAGSPTLAAGHGTQFYGNNANAKIYFTGCEL